MIAVAYSGRYILLKVLDMHVSRPTPGVFDGSLNEYLGTRLPPSSSSVPAIYRETTICYAYMCPYAYGCTEKATRPAQVLWRRCIRYFPKSMRIPPGLTEHTLDLLATHRQRGEQLSSATIAVLDQFRPDGPLRRR